MSSIVKCLTNKRKRAKQAKKHTEEIQNTYGQKIDESVKNTIIYNSDFICNKNIIGKDTEIIVKSSDTVHAGKMYYQDGKTALLNFASYRNPGGDFINGSETQEECLCHASYLYNVLSQFTTKFYNWNNKHSNRALYTNRGLYSPSILFQYEGALFECDVITCAAPNKTAAQNYKNVSNEENTEALKSRIKYIFDIAKDNEVEVLILGAYGCGVFGQNPTEVAQIFKKYLETTHKNCFNKVIFAIPDSNINENLKAFQEIFPNK